jgi:FkbH-like protein
LAGSIDDYLRSLDISIQVFENEVSLVPRISQMTQKTNQFNLTTKRYTESQIANFLLSKDYRVFAISVNDKFGDNGVTGVCIVNIDRMAKCASIDTFLMSCRIIGRNVEYVFFDFLIKRLIELNFTSIKAKYISTKKNEQVNDFYENLGFEVSKNENEIKDYLLETTDYRSKNIDYINIK